MKGKQVPEDKAALLDRFESADDVFRKALRGRDDAFMSSHWRMTAGDQVILDRPRYDVVRDFFIHHNLHHRGQLSVYLRLLDVPVPGTFGPTADFPDAM